MSYSVWSRALASRTLIAGAVLAMLAGPSFAQSPPASPTGARPGNDIGTGESLPRSNNASNTPGAAASSPIAPNLPSPQLGPNAGPIAYLQSARASLATGKTGEAQQSLEMAETRALDRSVPLGQTNTTSGDPLVGHIDTALRSLGAGDRPGAMRAIDAALGSAGRG